MMTQKLAALAALLAAFTVASGVRAADSSPPQITHTPVPKSAPGPLKLSARITDESKIFPQIFLRSGNASAYEQPIDMKRVKGSKDTFEVTITAKPGLEYYLECYDEYGNGPARSGSPDQPFKVEIVAEEPASAAGTPARAAPWLKGAPASGEQPAAESHKAAPAAEKPATAAPSPASDTAAPAEAASARDAGRPADKPAHQAAPLAHDTPADKPPAAHSESLRERPLSTALVGAGPIGAEGALVRSLLLPGFGQWKTDRPVRAAVFGGAAAAGVITSVVLALRANQANNVLNDAPILVRDSAHDQASSYARARNIAICLTAAVWLGQAAEAYFGYTHE